MRRKLLNLAAAVSLMLCLGFTGMMLRSLGQGDTWEYLGRDGRLVMVISKRGRLDVLHIRRWSGGDEPGLSYRTGSAPFALGGTDYSRRFLGFGAGVQPNGGRFVNLPYWSLAALSAVLPLLAARNLLRRPRSAAGVCHACGYDLRATPDRCPECGVVPAAPSHTAA
jgi:hypothetical protein